MSDSDESLTIRKIGIDQIPLVSGLTVRQFLASLTEREIWRVCGGYPSYEVSSHGKVRRLGKISCLSPSCVMGYEVVSLSEDGGTTNVRVHRLVAFEYLGEPPFEGAIVAHNDGSRNNNRLDNLRWASAVDNQYDCVRHNTRVRGSKVFGAKLTEDVIPAIRERLKTGAETQQEIGDDYGVSKHTIYLIAKNKIWKHAGGAAWKTM